MKVYSCIIYCIISHTNYKTTFAHPCTTHAAMIGWLMGPWTLFLVWVHDTKENLFNYYSSYNKSS